MTGNESTNETVAPTMNDLTPSEARFILANMKGNGGMTPEQLHELLTLADQ